jgi:subtilisin family serine protease
MLALFFAALTAATVTSTRCGTVEVPVGGLTDLRLLGCGEGFAENRLWHLDRADSLSGVLDQAVERRVTGKGAVIYIVDSGVMRDHDEFARSDGSNVIGTVVAAGSPSAPCADGKDRALYPCLRTDFDLIIYGHGTAVASMAAGKVTGVAPDAKIVSVFIEPSGTSATLWTQTLDRIVAHAFDPQTPQFNTGIINMSYSPGYVSSNDPGFPQLEQKIRDMIGGVNAAGQPDANGKRFVFTVMAGNFSADQTTQCDAQMRPAVFPSAVGRSIAGLITVGGIDETNHVWDRSCGGDAVDVYAPAANVLVASPSGRDRYRSSRLLNGQYPLNSGTSYAAPFVAGLAALLLEVGADMTPVEIERRIKKGASYVESGSERVAVMEGVAEKPVKWHRAGGH